MGAGTSGIVEIPHLDDRSVDDLIDEYADDNECEAVVIQDDESEQRICAECREKIGKRARVVTGKDGALFHSRCWSNL